MLQKYQDINIQIFPNWAFHSSCRIWFIFSKPKEAPRTATKCRSLKRRQWPKAKSATTSEDRKSSYTRPGYQNSGEIWSWGLWNFWKQWFMELHHLLWVFGIHPLEGSSYYKKNIEKQCLGRKRWRWRVLMEINNSLMNPCPWRSNQRGWGSPRARWNPIVDNMSETTIQAQPIIDKCNWRHKNSKLSTSSNLALNRKQMVLTLW